MRISTNTAAMRANREIETIAREKTTSLQRLSSGERISHAADDPAGLAISEKMKAKSRGKDQALRNSNDAISFIQVAEGSLGTMQEISLRLKELALQTATDSIGNGERALANMEFQQLKLEIKRLGESTQFNGRNLLENGSRYDMQVDVNGDKDSRIAYDMTKVFESLDYMGVQNLDITDNYRSRSALGVLDKAMNHLSEGRAKLGSLQGRMSTVINNLQVSNENILSSKSRIRDADFAEESAKKVSQDLRTDVSASFMVHALETDKLALKLLS